MNWDKSYCFVNPDFVADDAKRLVQNHGISYADALATIRQCMKAQEPLDADPMPTVPEQEIVPPTPSTGFPPRVNHYKGYANSNTGYVGVSENASDGKYRVQFRKKHLGTFDSLDEAIHTRRLAESVFDKCK